jgi:hypothetical protein
MLKHLKRHLFSVEAFFDYSIVLTFAFPKQELQNFIPPCLTLDTFNDQWAFIAIALVQTRQLRPKGFPSFLGNEFFLVGYRVFVRYTNAKGKRLRGLYIIESATNKKLMECLGNIFTQYAYTTIDITHAYHSNEHRISSQKANFYVSYNTISHEKIDLPHNSPFQTWNEARRFAGPLPFSFHYEADSNEVLIVEGVREHWTPQPLSVVDYHFDYFNHLPLSKPILANAFIIQNIPYFWKKGHIEQWHNTTTETLFKE